MQRMSQCFQFCALPEGEVHREGGLAAERTASAGPASVRAAGVMADETQWMCFGNIFHKLIYSRTEQKVSVTIFRPKVLAHLCCGKIPAAVLLSAICAIYARSLALLM